MAWRSRGEGKGRSPVYRFDLVSVLARGMFSAFLVFSVYNPSGISLFHWVRDGFAAYWMLQIPAAIMLAIFYFLALRATILVLRVVGIGIVVAILGSLFWALSDLGVIDLNNRVELELSVMLVLVGLLTVGISSMHVLTRLSGQINLDDLTEGGGR